MSIVIRSIHQNVFGCEVVLQADTKEEVPETGSETVVVDYDTSRRPLKAGKTTIISLDPFLDFALLGSDDKWKWNNSPESGTDES